MPDPENPRVVRCHGAGCERTLATVMQGPYDQAGREIRSLVLAREVRKNGSLAEVLLWREIKGKMLGCEFHRQTPIDDYIVDFYCHELRLAIEVDGGSHESPDVYGKDLKRQARLESLGVSFLRFGDKDVKQHLGEVVESIRIWIEDNASAE